MLLCKCDESGGIHTYRAVVLLCAWPRHCVVQLMELFGQCRPDVHNCAFVVRGSRKNSVFCSPSFRHLTPPAPASIRMEFDKFSNGSVRSLFDSLERKERALTIRPVRQWFDPHSLPSRWLYRPESSEASGRYSVYLWGRARD